MNVMMNGLRVFPRATESRYAELIGMRNGDGFAELLSVFEDASAARDLFTGEAGFDWPASYDQYALIEPGQMRPCDVYETHRTVWQTVGETDFEWWVDQWVRSHDADTLGNNQLRQIYGDEAEQVIRQRSTRH